MLSNVKFVKIGKGFWDPVRRELAEHIHGGELENLVVSGRLERAVHLQRAREEHLPVRRPRWRRLRALPVPAVHSERGPGETLLQAAR